MPRWFAPLTALFLPIVLLGGAKQEPQFQTSDRCQACHNGLKTSSGQDISIGLDWRASIMANAARDPYWQGSVRREVLDHPKSAAKVQDDCSICHMPMVYQQAKAADKLALPFDHLPFDPDKKDNAEAVDGVSCSVCHQITNQKLGTPASFNGQFVVSPADAQGKRTEYGPFEPTTGHQRVMQSSTIGYTPQQGMHIRDAALCATCHTLYTEALDADGKVIGELAEQVPYEEWLHSSYKDKRTCQSCHMPEVPEPVAITAIYGEPRQGMHRHVFVGANFVMQNMLNAHRDELAVAALPTELSEAAARTRAYLQQEAARLTLSILGDDSGKLTFEVLATNLGGHKLPTAYPARRAWLHATVLDRDGKIVFESGALNKDGSIVGNHNDLDPRRFEPHYREITRPDQVEIYESILKDQQGRVTTGLLSAVDYWKDNRLLPAGFDKSTASKHITPVGDALDDPGFTDKGSSIRYSIPTNGASGPYVVEVQLMYQPIGYRWAHNLGAYNGPEPQRFVSYFDQAAPESAQVLATARIAH